MDKNAVQTLIGQTERELRAALFDLGRHLLDLSQAPFKPTPDGPMECVDAAIHVQHRIGAIIVLAGQLELLDGQDRPAGARGGARPYNARRLASLDEGLRPSGGDPVDAVRLLENAARAGQGE